MSWLILNWKSVIAAACALMIGLSLGKLYGVNAGIDIGKEVMKAEILAAQAKADTKIRTRKKEIRHETQSMDRAAVVRELCNRRWVRNPEHCPK